MKKLYKEVILKNYDGLVSDCELLNECVGLKFDIDYCGRTTHIIYEINSRESSVFQKMVEKFRRDTDEFGVVYDFDGDLPVEELDNLYICLHSVMPLFRGLWLERGEDFLRVECNYNQSLILDKICLEIEKKYIDK